MPVNEHDQQQRMEGINLAFGQLTPIIKEQAEEIEKLQTEQGEVEVKKAGTKQYTYNLEENPSIMYKFPTFVSPANIEVKYEDFSFQNVFGKMHEEILKAEKPYHDIKNNPNLTNSHKLDVRANSLVEALSIKSDYLSKAEKEIERLKSVSASMPYMTGEEKIFNELSKISSIMYLQEILKEATANVEVIEDLYNQNQGNSEIRKILMLHAHKIFRVEKDERVRSKALKLYYSMKQEEDKFLSKDKLLELEKIIFNLKFIFKGESNRYPMNIAELNSNFKSADGSGVQYRRFFD